jgi:PLD-like domain
MLGNYGADNVIDNKKKLLREVLLTTLPQAESASFALGYFFISGFNVIIEPVKHLKKFRLLISNTTNQSTAEALIEGFKTLRQAKKELQKGKFVNQKKINEVKKDADKNFSKSLEQMDQTENDVHVVKELIEMMKQGKVEVRVYPKEKLHAKAYLFEGNSDFKKFTESNGIGIVGSSNLSLAGMEHNSELNLRTVHGADYDHLVDWFEELWKDGVDYTDDFEIILENSWAGKIRTPYEIYVKAMYHEVKDKLEGGHDIDPVWGTSFPKLFPFQHKAVDQALTMFDHYGGLILGDVVGLGKTYIGTALIKSRESLFYQIKDLYNKRSRFAHTGLRNEKNFHISPEDYSMALTILQSTIERLFELKKNGITHIQKKGIETFDQNSLDSFIEKLNFS